MIHAADTIAAKAHHLQRPLYASGRLRTHHAAQFKRKRHIASHRHVREQRVVLEHHADIALVRGHRDHFGITELEATAIRAGKAGQDRQQRGLARARRPEQRQKLATFDVQVNMVQCKDFAVSFGHLRDGDR